MISPLALAAVAFGTVIVVGTLLVAAHDGLENTITRTATDPRYQACKRRAAAGEAPRAGTPLVGRRSGR
jgi:hypothetical protein